MTQYDRYLRVVYWAQKRYTVGGLLVTYKGLVPAKYTRIERAAARKFLGETIVTIDGQRRTAC